MTTPFRLLCEYCGLSLREAADYLDVREDTARSWASGRRTVPAGALAQLHQLAHKIDRAADEALKVIADNAPDGAPIEIGYCTDDEEARSLGWPCVGAHNALIAAVLARIDDPGRLVLVPRGSTPATAAAADVHNR